MMTLFQRKRRLRSLGLGSSTQGNNTLKHRLFAPLLSLLSDGKCIGCSIIAAAVVYLTIVGVLMNNLAQLPIPASGKTNLNLLQRYDSSFNLRRISADNYHQLMLTPANQHYDGIFVITLQGTPNADPHNDGRLDNFKEAWRKSCGKDPEIHVCPGVIDDRRGYGLTQSWLTCLQMARNMDLDVTMVFEDDARLFDRNSSPMCDAGKRCSEVWKDLPEDTFIAFLGGHTLTYAAEQGEKNKERLGSQLSQYLETTFSYGTYGFAVPRRSLDTLLNTIKDDLAHGFIDEDGERETEFLSPEKSWYRKAREVGKKIYAIHPLSVWHESGFSNTWKMDRGSITGEEEDDGESGDEGWIRGIADDEAQTS